jgi:mannobiose 2-epimerase
MHPGKPCGVSLPDRLSRLAKLATDELQQNILPFWLNLADHDKGGFYGRAFSRSDVERDAPKSAVLQSRILWAFSAAHEFCPDARILAASEQAFDFIARYFFDPRSDGIFWSVSADGTPLNTRKHLYAQAFAIYGLATFHRIARTPDALALAIAIWRMLEDRTTVEGRAGYRESFYRNWRPSPNYQIGEPTAMSSFNAHLHLLEALQALWEVWPDPHLEERMTALVELLIEHHLDRQRGTFFQYFSIDWRPLDIGLSLGHDIEACWLVNKAAASLGPSIAAKAADALLPVALQVLELGVARDGGVMVGRDREGKWSRKKLWWAQAEALVGFLDAYERSGDVRFFDATERLWKFVSDRIIDRIDGEWRQQSSRTNSSSSRLPKADEWKCPYHNTRACIEIATRAARLRHDLNA